MALIRNPDYTEYREALSRSITNITMVINPEREVVDSILRIMSAPDVEEVSDFMGGRLKMLGKHLPADSPLNGLELAQLCRNLFPATAWSSQRWCGTTGSLFPRVPMCYGPAILFILPARPSTWTRFWACSAKRLLRLKNILVVGGGNIGFRLAQVLDQRRLNVRIIEKDPLRCQVISGKLRHTIVLQGLATDQKFLVQENIGAMDMVIAVTWDEEMNILVLSSRQAVGGQEDHDPD